MIPSPARAHYLAHIASEIVLIDNNVSTFFSGGVFKGLWNPNTSPNELPALSSTNDIYLVSQNSIYHSEVLMKGQLVKVNQPPALLLYEKILPVEFFISVVNSLLENISTEPSEGAGFVYGGELDATPQQIIQVAEFTDLDSCTVVNGLFTPTATGIAMSRHIAQAEHTDANIRFTWPDTSSSIFMVGFGTPASASMQDLGNASLSSSYVALGSNNGVGMDVTKFGENNPSMQENTGAVAGDIIILNFDYSTNEVRAYNETQEQSLMSVDVSAQNFNTPLVLFIYGTVPVVFDIASTGSPAKQMFQEVTIPENADGKTYRVTNTTEDSVIGGKLLKANDFATFFINGDVVDCVVNRLVSDTDIQAIVIASLNQPDTTLLELVNPVGDGVTAVDLENANEINIVVNGEYDPAPQFYFNLTDSCFNQNRLVRIRLNAAIAIPIFTIAHSNYYNEVVSLEDIAAETAWVFVFEKRGDYRELISKYQV